MLLLLLHATLLDREESWDCSWSAQVFILVRDENSAGAMPPAPGERRGHLGQRGSISAAASSAGSGLRSPSPALHGA
ncbi:hypothetical protein [Amycolatopsis magusensis]|uniref:Uncharacterized protein n=1 Tax=Amycolatopsis magusensis TaxID=882444 RepID=A0ABS4PTV3_9PSEU|nr:hypothetical protein [Amycolatopsis magusensis]MBP2182852.1 hypothetical protein [Amycolatopsis magusensis]